MMKIWILKLVKFIWCLCSLILSFVIVCKELWWPIPHSSLLESSPRIFSWADFSSCCRAVTVTARYYSNCCVLLTNSAQMQLYCSQWLAAAACLVSHSSELCWELGEIVLRLLCVFWFFSDSELDHHVLPALPLEPSLVNQSYPLTLVTIPQL